MRPKTLSKRALLILVPTGLVLFHTLFLSFVPTDSIQDSPEVLDENIVTFSNPEQVIPGLPLQLKIPVIGVDSTVIPVGLTPDGAMDVPNGPDEVAWYSLGPRPGENGSAVIAGHYGWKNNMPAVFDDLNQLREGDKISVEDENGVMTNFVVREIRIYSKDEDATNVFISDDGKAHLNLITCTGSWNNAERTFSDRLIIFTDKE